MHLRKLIEKTKTELNAYAVSSVSQLEYLLKTTTQEKIKKANSFVFNDLDNHVWLEKPNIVTFDNQNSYLIGVKLPDGDKHGWNVFLVDKNKTGYDKTYRSVIKQLEKCTFDSSPYELNDYFVMNFKPMGLMEFLQQITKTDLSEDAIQVEMSKFMKNKDSKDFVITEFSADLYQIDHALFQLNHTAQVVSDHFNTQPEFPTDITSHDYQIKYACTTYPKTKTDFYSHVFMTLGSGYYWDANGNLLEMDAIYKSEIDKRDINSIPKGELTHIYPAFDTEHNNLVNYPKNIQPQWQEARLEFIAQLKEIVNNFSTYSKEKQDEFLQVREGKPYFTIEQLEKFIEKCEAPKKSSKKKM
jgi:hypothetical protein